MIWFLHSAPVTYRSFLVSKFKHVFGKSNIQFSYSNPQIVNSAIQTFISVIQTFNSIEYLRIESLNGMYLGKVWIEELTEG